MNNSGGKETTFLTSEGEWAVWGPEQGGGTMGPGGPAPAPHAQGQGEEDVSGNIPAQSFSIREFQSFY